MAKIVNPDGTVADTSGNFGSGLYLPEVKEQMFGAFDNALSLDEDNDKDDDSLFKYGVYQLATQKPDDIQNIQKVYGTSAMPVFEWVKTIQTGERTYNPNNPEDKALLNQYDALTKNTGVPEGFLTPEQIEAELIKDLTRTVGTTVATNVGMALGDPLLDQAGFGTTQAIGEGLKSSVGFGLPDTSVTSLTNKQREILKANDAIYDPKIATKEAAELFELGDVYDQGTKVDLGGGLSGFKKLTGTTTGTEPSITGSGFEGDPIVFREGSSGGQTTTDNMIAGLDKETASLYESKGGAKATGNVSGSEIGTRTYTQRVADRFSDSRYQTAAVASAGTDFTLRLLQGEDPMDAATSAADTGVGTFIGGSLGGPVGAVIGATVAPKIFGRVICNELCRQNLMTKEDVVLDLKFTQKYLTQQHVNGYHAWAINVVRHLRKGKFIKLWKHIAQHRCNEIKYIMGKADKPDYLGKIYRHVFETTCFIVGYFKKQTDWSVLYKGEKNGT